VTRRLTKAVKITVTTAVALLLVVIATWLTRAEWLPSAIAKAPNAGRSTERLGTAARPVISGVTVRELRVEVGPPSASLAVWTLEAASKPPRATVIVLHGIRDNKSSMLGVGRSLAEAGYRAVLVDLRGHGSSTGEWLSFGDREGRDLLQLDDALVKQGLLVRPLGVYGASYGGAAALQLARRDARVGAVVTVATYTRMRDIVPLYVHRLVPSWFISSEDIHSSIDHAGLLGDFVPDQADSVLAIQATSAQVLLFHGRDDANIPFEHSLALHAAAPDHSHLVLLDNRDHVTIMGDPRVSHEALAWLTQHLPPPQPD
jgi:pimeloyl-ACP methyl ester carboxylesterase